MSMAATVAWGSVGVVSPKVPSPGARWLTRASGSSLKALPPSPSFSSVVRWFHTKVILHIPLILSKLWEILRKSTRRQNTTNAAKCSAATTEKKKVTARIYKSNIYTQGKVSTLMFPLSVLSPFLGSFFMPLVSVKFSDHCHFLHFSAELLALGGNIARNICRLIVDCAGHWHHAEISLSGSL